jgi:hypothetical protein
VEVVLNVPDYNGAFAELSFFLDGETTKKGIFRDF